MRVHVHATARRRAATFQLNGAVRVQGFEEYGFAPGPSGGVILRKCTENEMRDVQHEARCVIDLLTTLDKADLTAAAFARLLDAYVATCAKEADSAGGPAQGAGPSPSPSVEEAVMAAVAGSAAKENEQASLRRVLLLEALAQMCEELGPDIVSTDFTQGVRFIKVMLTTDNEENIILCVGMLETLLGGLLQLDKGQFAALAALSPDLLPLETHANGLIADKVTAVRIAIATQNPAWVSDGAQPSKPQAAKLVQVLKDLEDPLLPIRSHALVELRKLVLAKDEATVTNLDSIFALFNANLDNDDSYLYLAAINGLVAMGDVFPSKVVPVLFEEFLDAKVRLETRLKVGETLMKVAKRCGEVLPHHLGLFLPRLLAAVRDPEAGIRASALSSLATMVELLRYSVHSFIEELLSCVATVLASDPATEPQRGAIHILNLLLRGLGSDAWDVLETSLTPIYRLLKDTEANNPDEIVRYHARAALAELNKIVSRFMQPEAKGLPGVFLPSHFPNAR